MIDSNNLIPIDVSVKLNDDDSIGRKIVDAALIRANGSPIIAVEVGFTQTLDSLFEEAERILNGCRDVVEVVILIKVYEDRRHTSDEFPWGIPHNDRKSLQSLSDQNTLIPTIRDFYEEKGLPLLGDLRVDVHWYNRAGKHAPWFLCTHSGAHHKELCCLGLSAQISRRMAKH